MVEVESYRGLSGSGVVASPVFKENLLSFAVCYGLALQGLGRSKLWTNLLPREILTDRLIRDKKPWGVGVAAALLLGFTLSILGYWRAWNSVHPSKFDTVLKQADEVEHKANEYSTAYAEKKTAFDQFDQMGKNIVGNVEGRLMWIEVLKALDACLPGDPPLDADAPGEPAAADEAANDPPGQKRNTDISRREELHITELDCEHLTDWPPGTRTCKDRSKRSRPRWGERSPRRRQRPAQGRQDPGCPARGRQDQGCPAQCRQDRECPVG